MPCTASPGAADGGPLSRVSEWSLPVAVVIAALALAGALAGCGGSGSRGTGMMRDGSGVMSGAPATTSGGLPPTTTTAAGNAAGEDGRALFLAGGCGGCHTLAAAGSTGTAGPNLDKVHPSYDLVVHWTTDGGGGMPSFAGSLSNAQIEAIARYVSGAAR